MKIAVLMGGNSEERDVSLASGCGVARALREGGHDVVGVDTTGGVLSIEEEEALLATGVGIEVPDPDALDLLDTGDVTLLTRDPRVAEVDVLFLALHGGLGEDGTLQALLDLTGIPYTGSGHLGCALAMDKDVSKHLLRDVGIPTPDWMVGDVPLEEVTERLGLPVIVKPPSGGSTVGLTLAHDMGELAQGVELSRSYEKRVLFERYIGGREVTVPILADEALPVGEIIPEHEIFDYECKYQPGMAQEIFPAEIGPELASELQDLALRAHRVLRMSDLSRIDFIVDGEGVPWCLEANALPGLTGNSLVPKSARAAGISFSELCERIALQALERRSREALP